MHTLRTSCKHYLRMCEVTPNTRHILYKDCSVNLCDDGSKFLAGETKANKKKEEPT